MKCGIPILMGHLPLNFCVVWSPVIYAKSLSLILVDFWEGWGGVEGEVFGLSVCQSNPYLGGNMKGNPCWNMLSV